MWPEPRIKGSSSCDDTQDTRAVTIAILLLFTWATINKLLEGPLVLKERQKKKLKRVKKLRSDGSSDFSTVSAQHVLYWW